MSKDSPIFVAFGQKLLKGDVGIEIEMEASNPFPMGAPKNWDLHADGSLRGFSAEYVSRNPIAMSKLTEHLNTLKDWLNGKTSGGSPVNVLKSFRAGVHVHQNCQELTLKQVANIAATYYCLEEALVKFCGTNREGNLFCLRLKDAEYPLFLLIRALKDKSPNRILTDEIRYSSLNLRSLGVHGTLEFRAMETEADLSRIYEWVHLLWAVRTYALNLNSREEIATEISFYGPEDWAKKVFGPALFDVINYPGLSSDILRCMRNVQELIFLEE